MNIVKPNWPALPHVKAFTTLRSTPFSLQEPGGLVDCLPDEPIWLKQVHGNQVIEAITAHRGTEADAAYASKPNSICVVQTADCLPILVTTLSGTQVAAIHAGWRGLAKGIIKTTLDAMGDAREDCMVWLGPAIGPRKFEVGLDVFEVFTDKSSENEKAFFPLGNQKWLANLYDLARLQLQSEGIERIYGGHFCTYSQADLFYSARRERENPKRMSSLIWIEIE